MLECYGNLLYSVKALEGCGLTHFVPYGSATSGPVCNFHGGLRFNGVKKRDDFQFNCKDGNLDRVEYRGR